MSAYKNISNELKSFFSTHRVFKILLPLDMVILFGGLGVLAVDKIISVGGFLSAVAYYAFLLGLLLTYANYNEKFLYTGFFTYAALQAFSVIKLAVSFRYFNFSLLIGCLVYGGIGYLIFKQTANFQKRGSSDSFSA